jgi:hypothetical protein
MRSGLVVAMVTVGVVPDGATPLPEEVLSPAMAAEEPAESLQSRPVTRQWNFADIGNARPTGSYAGDESTLSLTGARAGTGVNINGKDQAFFTYVRCKPGDFEIVALLVEISGEKDAAAGIMARRDNTPSGVMTALFFKSKENTLGWFSRIPGERRTSKEQVLTRAIGLAKKPPLWLKMVRVDKNFAVYNQTFCLRLGLPVALAPVVIASPSDTGVEICHLPPFEPRPGRTRRGYLGRRRSPIGSPCIQRAVRPAN